MSGKPGKRSRGRQSGLKDVAERAGVSVGLVSRVLNGDPTVRTRESTRAAIIAASRDLDYSPDAAARALRYKKAGVLGLALHDLSTTMSQRMVSRAREAALNLGYLLLMVDADELAASPRARSAYLSGGRVDGLMIQGGHDDMTGAIAEMADRLPTVVLKSPGFGGLAGVRVDEELAGQAAADHLVELGHKRVGFIGGVQDSFTNMSRLSGVRRALEKAGLPGPIMAVKGGDWTSSSGARQFEEVLRLGKRKVTGIVAVNANVAMGVLRAAADTGVVVPDDVSVVSALEGWMSPYTVPRLSAVSLPLDQLGETAVTQLVAILEGKHVPLDVVISEPDPLLVARESTSTPKTCR